MSRQHWLGVESMLMEPFVAVANHYGFTRQGDEHIFVHPDGHTIMLSESNWALHRNWQDDILRHSQYGYGPEQLDFYLRRTMTTPIASTRTPRDRDTIEEFARYVGANVTDLAILEVLLDLRDLLQKREP